MDVLLKEIGQVAIFLICAQTLLHFRAKDSYEKYIRLLISMMLLLLLAEPFLELFSTKEGGGFMDKMAVYEQRMEEVMGNGLLQEEEIEQILQGITQEKVVQGVEYVQGQQEGGEQQTQIMIEKIEIGGQDGEP